MIRSLAGLCVFNAFRSRESKVALLPARLMDLLHAQGAFPSGLRSLTNELGAPLVMHMGQLVGNSSSFGPPPYATDPSVPGQSSWVVEERGSLPLGNGSDLFWDSLFANASDWGLAVFKLDHAESRK